MECGIVLAHGPQQIPFTAIEVKKPGPREDGYVDKNTQFNHYGQVEQKIFSCAASKDDHKQNKLKSEDDDAVGQYDGLIDGRVLGQNLDQLHALECGGSAAAYGLIATGNTLMLTQNNGGEFDVKTTGPTTDDQ